MVCRLLLAVLAGLLGVAALRAAAPGEAGMRLRALLRMPEIQIEVEFGLDNRQGLDAWDPVTDPAAEARRLEGLLRGDEADAMLLDRIADLQSKAGLTAPASESRQRAIRRCRDAVAIHPEDPQRLARLGWVVSPEDAVEAEQLLRLAASRAPGDPFCQRMLGRWLTQRALFAAAAIPREASPAHREALQADARRTIPEARAALDRAVESAPENLEARVDRMLFHWFRSLGMLGGEETDIAGDTPGFDVTVMRGYVLPDLRKARQVAPDDFRILALRTWVLALCTRMESGLESGSLVEVSRHDVVEGIASLEALAASSREFAREAAIREAVAALQLVLLEDHAAAAVSAARALELQPTRRKAWAIRAAALRGAGREEELTQFLESTLQRTNSATVRLILAKVAYREGRTATAREQVDTTLRLAPDDLRARAFDLTLRLRETTEPGGVDAVGMALQGCLEKLSSWEPASDRPALFEHLGVTAAACYALAGDWGRAREFLAQVRTQFPESEYVSEVAAVLESGPDG
ncbi:MAG: hypothetical protein KF791_13620 [Verrucomicrobiae bacterium]|nr:hypothetical protein [Verrucomicrobiae bacterium]